MQKPDNSSTAEHSTRLELALFYVWIIVRMAADCLHAAELVALRPGAHLETDLLSTQQQLLAAPISNLSTS
jgi:hypothetical protein